ncbi:MAG TPA: hypothetical protein DHV28_16425 [Ignavibacteriales bacterium]|nr:hypothetical protein [Ignavibacteriales bacterium]
MKKYVLINGENKFPRTREINSFKEEIPFVFTKREGKEFTNRLDETEVFDHEFDDPKQKKEFYSLLFKTNLEIFSF